MRGRPNTRSQDYIFINTKGVCLLCYDDCPKEAEKQRENTQASVNFCKLLSRHLGFSIDKQIVTHLKTMSKCEQQNKVGIELCERCSKLANAFCHVYFRVQFNQMTLSHCVRTISELIRSSDKKIEQTLSPEKDGKKLSKLQQSLKSRCFKSANNLRSMVKQKCSTNLSASLPIVKLKRISISEKPPTSNNVISIKNTHHELEYDKVLLSLLGCIISFWIVISLSFINPDEIISERKKLQPQPEVKHKKEQGKKLKPTKASPKLLPSRTATKDKPPPCQALPNTPHQQITQPTLRNLQLLAQGNDNMNNVPELQKISASHSQPLVHGLLPANATVVPNVNPSVPARPAPSYPYSSQYQISSSCSPGTSHPNPTLNYNYTQTPVPPTYNTPLSNITVYPPSTSIIAPTPVPVQSYTTYTQQTNYTNYNYTTYEPAPTPFNGAYNVAPPPAPSTYNNSSYNVVQPAFNNVYNYVVPETNQGIHNNVYNATPTILNSPNSNYAAPGTFVNNYNAVPQQEVNSTYNYNTPGTFSSHSRTNTNNQVPDTSQNFGIGTGTSYASSNNGYMTHSPASSTPSQQLTVSPYNSPASTSSNLQAPDFVSYASPSSGIVPMDTLSDSPVKEEPTLTYAIERPDQASAEDQQVQFEQTPAGNETKPGFGQATFPESHSSQKAIPRSNSCSEAGCSEAFVTKGQLELHLRSHGSFKCNFCHLTFGKAHNLAIHEVTRHSNSIIRGGTKEALKCSRCVFSSGSQQVFLLHFIMEHLGVNLYDKKCLICKKDFLVGTSSAVMQLHHRKYHDVRGVDSSAFLTCSECNAPFLKKKQLSDHQQMMHGQFSSSS